MSHDRDFSCGVVADFLASMPDLLLGFLAGVILSETANGIEDFGMIGLRSLAIGLLRMVGVRATIALAACGGSPILLQHLL